MASVVIAVAAVATFAYPLAAPTAGAATGPHHARKTHRHGRAQRAVIHRRGPRGIVRVHKAGRGGRAIAHAATATTCSTNPCLQYHGGPVLHSNTGYVIYWQPNPLPSGVSAFPTNPSYEGLVNQYFTDLQAANGVFSNVYSVATQYTDASGNVQSGFTATTPIYDSDPLPPRQCTDTPLTTCLTDQQIQAEIDHVVTSYGLPRGAGPIYFLVTPQGIGSCFSANPGDACYDQNGGYCAYHSDMNLGDGETLYANMPYDDVNGCQTGASPPDHPNSNAADDLISVLSHEQIETMTDPEGTVRGTYGAWYHDGTSQADPTAGEEIADVCASDYGTSLGSISGAPYNQGIGSGKYELQTEWSNADNGCRQNEPTAPPSVTLGRPPTVYVNQTATLSASSDQPVTYYWDFGDGSTPVVGGGAQSHTYAAASTYTVSVYAVNGATGQRSPTVTETATVLNPQPVAAFVVTTNGQTVAVDGTASSDTGGPGITSWHWDFGDLSSASGPAASHAYVAPGPETITLTVTDGDGISSSSSQTITVAAPPAAPVVPPSQHTAQVSLKEISIAPSVAVHGLLSHGLLVDVRCTGVCRASLHLLLRVRSARSGRRLQAPKFVEVEIGHARGLAGSDGLLRLRVNLTASGRRRLQGMRHPAVTVLVDAMGAELSKTVHVA